MISNQNGYDIELLYFIWLRWHSLFFFFFFAEEKCFLKLLLCWYGEKRSFNNFYLQVGFHFWNLASQHCWVGLNLPNSRTLLFFKYHFYKPWTGLVNMQSYEWICASYPIITDFCRASGVVLIDRALCWFPSARNMVNTQQGVKLKMPSHICMSLKITIRIRSTF